jgi:hypothetical protein
MATVWKDTQVKGRTVWCIKYKGLDLKWHRERTEAQNKDQAQRLLSKRLAEIAIAKASLASSLKVNHISKYVGGPTLLAMAREVVKYRNCSTEANEESVIDLITEVHQTSEHIQQNEHCPICPALLSGKLKATENTPPWLKGGSV